MTATQNRDRVVVKSMKQSTINQSTPNQSTINQWTINQLIDQQSINNQKSSINKSTDQWINNQYQHYISNERGSSSLIWILVRHKNLTNETQAARTIKLYAQNRCMISQNRQSF